MLGLMRIRRGAKSAKPPLILRIGGGAEEFTELFGIGEKIGEGAFGKVFACRERAGGGCEPLCVKVGALNGRHSPMPPERRGNLVRLLHSAHPHIVRYHRLLESRDALYIVMERCCGPDLMEHVEACGGLLSMEAIRIAAQQMLGAVATVHALGLMHRDVKPENFRFVDATARSLKLLDFGSSKNATLELAAHTMVGTLVYAAPEVFDGMYSQSCDLWSLGVVLFFLMSGQLPFETADAVILRSMHRDPILTGDCLFRGERWNEVPTAARSLVRGLLCVDPASRLSASMALEHGWVRGDVAEEDAVAAGPLAMARLARTSSGRVISGSKTNLRETDLKRSYFAWNLAEEGGDGDESPCG